MRQPSTALLLSSILVGVAPLFISTLSTVAAQTGAAQDKKDDGADRPAVEPADPKWLDRLPKDDRAALDALLGYAPPPFTSELKWIGSSPATWNDMRGRVVVVQSWTSGNTAGRRWPERLAEALAAFDANDLRIIALHTPEGAESVEAFLARKPAPDSVTVVVDPKGAFLDSLAIYKRPVNLVIDRHGAVRYAGLNMSGVEEAVKKLIAEPFDSSKVAAAAPVEAKVEAEFPPIVGSVSNALDVRGERAPEMYVEQWLSKRPSAEGKVVVLDFWATWCPPCVASIPHMNDLASRFSGDVVVVGISDEEQDKFERGMQDKKLTPDSFKYALALDPGAKMKKALEIKGIPNALVMDRNWIVRWQGHPTQLTPAILEQIIRADRAAVGGGAGKSSQAKRRGWTTE